MTEIPLTSRNKSVSRVRNTMPIHSTLKKQEKNDPCPFTRKLQNNVISGECEIGSPSQQDGERVRMNGCV